MWLHALETAGLALVIPAVALLVIVALEYVPGDRAEDMPYPSYLAGVPSRAKLPPGRKRDAA